MTLDRFYLLMAVVGTIVPWIFFGSFFASHGLNMPAFVSALFSNGPSGGFTADILISITVFLVWSFVDAKRNAIERWWLVIPPTFMVGLSLSLPFYLYLRERKSLTQSL